MSSQQILGSDRQYDISVVIPLFNEEKNIDLLYDKLKVALDKINRRYQIIMVDDGSTDKTLSVLKEIHQRDKTLRVISFRRNFGQAAALSAGFDWAKGDIVIAMDGDLQNHPEDIPLLLRKIEEGYDVVSGWRVERKDPFLTRRLPSSVANFIISWVSKVKLHDYGCTLKAYRREVVDNLRLYGEMHRFIPSLASLMGASVAEVKVKHSPRTHGKSKYNLSRTIRVILDLFTVKFFLSFATRPIQIFGLIGIFSSLVGFILAAYLSVKKIFFGHPLADRPLLLLAILLILMGVQFITMGLLGEMLARTYYETQKKPTYLIKEVLD